MTVTQTMSDTAEKDALYAEQGPMKVPVYEKQWYYKNWFYKLIKKKSWRTVFKGYDNVTGNTTVHQNYGKTTWGEPRWLLPALQKAITAR